MATGETVKAPLLGVLLPVSAFLASLTAFAGVDLDIDGSTYAEAEVVREFPESIQIRFRGGTAFVDRSKLSDEQLSRLTGQSIITPEQRTAPPLREQKDPYEPPEPRIYDRCQHHFAGPRRPSSGMFRGLPSGREAVPSTGEPMEHKVFRLVNAERRSRGLPPFKWNENLARAARYHAADMVDGEYFEHDSFDRVGTEGRVVLRKIGNAAQRVRAFWNAFSAENIAQGPSDAQTVMRGWMASAGHRRNILCKSSSSIGVGFVHGVWVQNFGRDLPKASEPKNP